MTYRSVRYYRRAVDYFKCQLALAWELNDEDAEIRSYDNLAIEYYYIGNIKKAQLYHERVLHGRVESKNSMAKVASQALNNYKRNMKKSEFKFDQFGIKGTEAANVERRPNYGEYSEVQRSVMVNLMADIEDAANGRQASRSPSSLNRDVVASAND